MNKVDKEFLIVAYLGVAMLTMSFFSGNEIVTDRLLEIFKLTMVGLIGYMSKN